MIIFLYVLIVEINSVNFAQFIQGDWNIYENDPYNSLASINIHYNKSIQEFRGYIWINNETGTQTNEIQAEDIYDPLTFFISSITLYDIRNNNGKIKIHNSNPEYNLELQTFSYTSNSTYQLILTAESPLIKIECLFSNNTQAKLNLIKQNNEQLHFTAIKSKPLHYIQWAKYFPFVFILILLLVLLHTSMSLRSIYKQNAEKERRKQILKHLDEEGKNGNEKVDDDGIEAHIKTD